jgi:hypothetical protein
MIHVGSPVFFPIVFGLIGLGIVWMNLDLWLYRSVVEATGDCLRCRGGLLGLGRTHRYAADQIKTITTSEYLSSGTHVWTNIVLVPASGKKRTIAKGISSKLVERAVVGELNEALRRKSA